MTKWSDRHRRRLHMVSGDSTNSEPEEIATTDKEFSNSLSGSSSSFDETEEEESLEKQDEPAPISSNEIQSQESDSLKASSAKEEKKLETPLEPGRKKAASRKKKTKQKAKQKSSQSKPHSKNRFFMNYLRHGIALAILVGFGYLYTEHQKNQVAVDNETSTESDPFSNWDQIAEAPAFGADTVSMTSQKTPDPISIDENSNAEYGQVPANLTKWIESQNDLPAEEENVPEPISVSESSPQRSNLRDRSYSLWDEPNSDEETISSKNSFQGSQVKDPFSQKNKKGHVSKKESIASLTEDRELEKLIKEKIRKRPQNKNSYFEETETEHPSKKDTSQGALTDKEISPKKPATVELWRKFTLGAGKETIVCVVDESVSRDSLLLSTIFTGIRREWISDVSRSRVQKLVLIISNNKSSAKIPKNFFTSYSGGPGRKKQELENKIAAVKPSRIVYLSRGKDNRGQIKFSSEEESIAALISVPGIYRITTQKENLGQYQSKPDQVLIELPKQDDSQESTTVDLLCTAISNSWNGTNGNGVSQANEQASRDGSQSSSSFEGTRENSSESHSMQYQRKSRVEKLPPPAIYSTQVETTHKTPSKKSFYKLPPPPPVRRGN